MTSKVTSSSDSLRIFHFIMEGLILASMSSKNKAGCLRGIRDAVGEAHAFETLGWNWMLRAHRSKSLERQQEKEAYGERSKAV